MKRLVPSSDRVLFKLSIWMFVLSATLPLVILLHWPTVFRVVGVFGLLGCPAYLLLAVWQMLRYERSWRTIAAVVLLAVATVMAWSTTILYVTVELH
jgi:hypothetical protein